MAHVTDEELEQYALDRLEEDDAAPVEEHLLFCEDCRNRLQAMDEYVAAMRVALGELEAEQQPVDSAKARKYPPIGQFLKPKQTALFLAAAASLLIIVPLWLGQSEPYELHLRALRGVEESLMPAAPANQSLRLAVNLDGLVVGRDLVLELVDSGGDTVWADTVRAEGNEATAEVGKTLAAGQYWVRLYTPTQSEPERGELLREFGLRVEKAND